MELQVMTIRKSIARSDRRSVKGIDMWSMDADEFVRNEQASRKNARGISNKFSLFETLELLAIKTKRNPVTGLGLVIPKLLAQLETFRNLSSNWDSYGALPIEERALARARLLLNSLSLQLVGLRAGRKRACISYARWWHTGGTGPRQCLDGNRGTPRWNRGLPAFHGARRSHWHLH